MRKHLEKIHELALRILQEVGVKLFHAEIRERLLEKGIAVAGDTAFFTPEQIAHWVSHAPQQFTLHARNPHYDVTIGGENCECVAGYGCASVIEGDGSRRDTLLNDYVTLAKLVHQSDHFNINGGILAQPADIPAEQSHLVMLYAAMLYSDKCLLGIPGSAGQMQAIMDMGAILFGGKENFAAKPHILTMISTISPLQLDDIALSSIKIAAQHGQPLILSPAPATGTTGPVDMASNLALATAEALAGIVIAQVVNPGNPVIFGLQCYGADLQSGNISIGSPAYALQARYTAALARMYELPSRCGGCATDAKDVSPQSGYESMLSMFTACQNRVNLIVHSAGILDSFSGISYEQFIMDLEIISMIKFYLGNIAVTEETLNYDLIQSIGPGGQFLTSMDTLRKCRTHCWNPEISLRSVKPGTSPHDQFMANIINQKRKMLDAYEQPEMDPIVSAELAQFLRDKGIGSSVLKRIQSAAA